MTVSSSSKRIALNLLACAALLGLACGIAQAQVKPFKITGKGAGPTGLPLPGQPPRLHWAIGEATHLGRYYGEGTVETLTAAPTATGFAGTFGSGSPFVFAAANGDKLVCWYGRTDLPLNGSRASQPGTFELTVVDFTAGGAPIVTALWLAEFVVQPGDSTGRFSGVTGSWVMVARSAPFVLGSNDPVLYSWEGQGKLTFPKK